MALMVGFGADGVCPWVAYDAFSRMNEDGLVRALTENDVFRICQLSISDVVVSGLTLAQASIVAMMLAHRSSSRVFTECYHLDSGRCTLEAFRAALAEGLVLPDGLLIINFCAPMAHPQGLGGGGHFSLLTGFDRPGKLLITPSCLLKPLLKGGFAFSFLFGKKCKHLRFSLCRHSSFCT